VSRFGNIRVGRVVGVYPERGTCDVSLEGSGQTITGVRMRVDEHPSFGDQMLLVQPSGVSSEWFAVNQPYEAGVGNPEHLEGAKGLRSPSGAHVLLHPDGTVEFRDSSFSRLAMIPAKKLLEMNVLRHRIVSPHGSIIWEPETFNVNVGGGGQDVKLFLGSAGSNFGAGDWAGGKDVGAALRVGSVYRTEVAKDGSVSVVTKDHLTEVQGDAQAVILGDTDIETEDVTVVGADYDIAVGNLVVAVEETLSIEATTVQLLADLIQVNEADGPAMDGFGYLKWLETEVIPKGGMITPDMLKSFVEMVLNQKFWL